MQNTIQYLPHNDGGRDFVFGDLHGCYDLLMRLLNEVAYNPALDRLFSVGDLIDRGPKSLQCLELIAESSFYAVKGNHERMLEVFFQSYSKNGFMYEMEDTDDTGFLDYGGEWVVDYYQPDKTCMTKAFDNALARVATLPLVWVIGEGKQRFHIVHAELVKTTHSRNIAQLCQDKDIDNWLALGGIPEQQQDPLLWSRVIHYHHQDYRDLPSIHPGLSPSFCGHSVVKNPQQVQSHICLDTGAFLTLDEYNSHQAHHGLTLFIVHEQCWVNASYQREQLVWGSLADSLWA